MQLLSGFVSSHLRFGGICCDDRMRSSLHSEDFIQSLPLWRESGRASAQGAETDGSSSCQSDLKALEQSLQSVVPVLNIEGSNTQLGAASSCESSLFLFPLHLYLLSATSSVAFACTESVLCSRRLHLVPSPCTCTPLLPPPCVCDSITLVSSC